MKEKSILIPKFNSFELKHSKNEKTDIIKHGKVRK